MAIVAKLVCSFPKKIVRLAVAFLFGETITVSASEPDDSYKIFKDIWEKKLKMHLTLKRFARTVMVETKAALLFYPVVVNQVKFLGITIKSKVKLKVKLLDVKAGQFFLHYDNFGDMDAFIWKYKGKVEGKKVDIVKIYTSDQMITAIKTGS
ncbi:hypothetical protein L3073_02815 [Ancylomarina sp. DW003]|nr:hypothetical protein [Ancylomarina sp. DW003]MDE5421134.1 hypothetical protein [Ancylomarina sp. DW003]